MRTKRVEIESDVDLRSLVREAGYRHSHASGADEGNDEDEQVGRVTRNMRSDFSSYWNQQHAGNGMADECRNDLWSGS